MTHRWEQEDLDATMAENSDLALINQKINGSTLFGMKVEVDTRGHPLPRLARALEAQAKREKHRSKQEDEFLEKIIVLAHLHHWRVAHFRPARVIKDGKITYRTAVSADGKGFPDLVLVRGERIIVAELKSRTGKLSKEQGDWLEAFSKTGVEVFCWRPTDWNTAVKELS